MRGTPLFFPKCNQLSVPLFFLISITMTFSLKNKVLLPAKLYFSVGGKKGNRTEPNRTEPPDYTGQSLRKLPIVAVPGFTAITELNYLA